jgi:SAM-dependent MidA family methyltransferase
MEQALYHPQHGYYSSGRAVIGRKGDYFTNVSVGPLFGQLLAAQFVEIWERLGKIDNFTIVDQGAHDGQFARDVLTELRVKSPEFFSTLHYRIVEPFPVWQDRQSQTLRPFRDKVEWRSRLSSLRSADPHLNPLPQGEADAKRQVRVDELEPFVGVHFSNELLDAMPMNLRGKFVGLDDDKFVFVEGPTDASMNKATLDWIDNLSSKLERGFVIAIDYGFVREDFREVLQARAQHRLLDSPFEQIGDADITAHINWTEIAERAETNGLHIAGFTDQHHFFTGIISAWPNLLSASVLNLTALSSQVHRADEDAKSKRALQTLLHPEMLGRAFQVLALGKDADLAGPLAGFTFARDPRAALGI